MLRIAMQSTLFIYVVKVTTIISGTDDFLLLFTIYSGSQVRKTKCNNSECQK
jgi:hypothetical protein